MWNFCYICVLCADCLVLWCFDVLAYCRCCWCDGQEVSPVEKSWVFIELCGWAESSLLLGHGRALKVDVMLLMKILVTNSRGWACEWCSISWKYRYSWVTISRQRESKLGVHFNRDGVSELLNKAAEIDDRFKCMYVSNKGNKLHRISWIEDLGMRQSHGVLGETNQNALQEQQTGFMN